MKNGDNSLDALIASIFERRPSTRAGVFPSSLPLRALATLAEITASLKGAERAWILAARSDGHSWREIGEALGIAPQSARERVHGRPRPRGVRR